MLNLLRGIRIAGVRAEPLHPGVRDPIYEDDERFYEFGGDRVARRRAIPGPSELRERAQEPSEGY